MDLVEALAAPLPVQVIGDLLGVPECDFARVPVLHPAAGHRHAGRPRRLRHGAVGMLDLLRELVAHRRVAPGDDLFSALVAVQEAGDRLRRTS